MEALITFLARLTECTVNYSGMTTVLNDPEHAYEGIRLKTHTSKAGTRSIHWGSGMVAGCTIPGTTDHGMFDHWAERADWSN